MLICLRCGGKIIVGKSALPNGYNGELKSEVAYICDKCGSITIDEIKFVE